MKSSNIQPGTDETWRLDSLMTDDQPTLDRILDSARRAALTLTRIRPVARADSLKALLQHLIHFQVNYSRLDTYRRLASLNNQPLSRRFIRTWQAVRSIHETMVTPVLATVAQLPNEQLEQVMQGSELVKKHGPWFDINRYRHQVGLNGVQPIMGSNVRRHRESVKHLLVPLSRNRIVNLSECKSIINADPDGPRRRHALMTLNRELCDQGITGLAVTALRDIVTAHAVRFASSGCTQPDMRRNEMNGLSDESVSNLHQQVLTLAPSLVAAQVSLKRRLLNTNRIQWTDLYGPVPCLPAPPRLSFTDAERVLQDMLVQNELPAAAILLHHMRRSGKIDAAPRKNKPSGASCTAWNVPDGGLAFIRLNWYGLERNLETLAHEFGHALRHHLANRQNGPLLAASSMLLSETAALLMESLLFSHRSAQARAMKDYRTELRLTVSRIDALMHSIVQQVVASLFEYELHTQGTKPLQRLSILNVSRIWVKQHRRVYGNEVDLSGIEYLWSKSLHIHRPFAVYAYAAAELLVTRLLSGNRRPAAPDTRGRPAWLHEVLVNGQRLTLRELLARQGLDPEAPTFWNDSLVATLPPLFDRAEQLLNELNL